jgi:four helix bundle protein
LTRGTHIEAEGQGRLSKGEFRVFLGNARGSLCELETQILIVQNLNYIDQQEASILVDLSSEIGRILNGLYSFYEKIAVLSQLTTGY